MYLHMLKFEELSSLIGWSLDLIRFFQVQSLWDCVRVVQAQELVCAGEIGAAEKDGQGLRINLSTCSSRLYKGRSSPDPSSYRCPPPIFRLIFLKLECGAGKAASRNPFANDVALFFVKLRTSTATARPIQSFDTDLYQ